MNMQKIKIDAEDVKVKNGHLISIGEKINKQLPKYQYMGIIKLKLNDYHKLRKYFKKLKMQKINFTKFIDMAVKDKIIEINVVKTNKYWLEIDNSSDLKFAKGNYGSLDYRVIWKWQNIFAKKFSRIIKIKKIITIDGDEVRKYITYRLKYNISDRKKNSLVISDLCRYLESKGYIVICSILSIFRSHQKKEIENI